MLSRTYNLKMFKKLNTGENIMMSSKGSNDIKSVPNNNNNNNNNNNTTTTTINNNDDD